MANRLVEKVMGIMGFEDEGQDEDTRLREDRFENEEAAPAVKKKGQLLSLHSQRQVNVVITEPRSFDEVQSITDNLKNRRPVVVNLEKADQDLAKRVVDFVSGATYALNGSLQKVGNGIFLFVPSNMGIASELKEQIKERGAFAWIR